MREDINLNEQLLLEKSRQELISKSKSANRTKAYGTTRWDRRRYTKIYPTVRNYDKVDMNALFKANLLNFIVPIHGDRDLQAKEGREEKDYSVEVLFEGVCDKIQAELKKNNYKLEFKVVYRAIVNAINQSDVLVSCTCDDWKYRHSYQATKQQYNAGKPELRPANETNPGDTEGAGCKHVMNVLGNVEWAMKLASCVNNYIFYIKDHYEDKFASIIWPAISGMEYNKAYQMGLFDDLASTVDTGDSEGELAAANEYGRKRTQFKRKQDDQIEDPEDFDDQLSLDLEDSEGGSV